MKTLDCEADADEVVRRLEALTASDARRWGRMSVGEMVCHVRDSFGLALGDVKTRSRWVPLPNGVMKFFVLKVPVRWPHGVPTIPELKAGGAASAPAGFASDMAGLRGMLDRFLGQREMPVEHPFFGRMERGEWMRWGYLHTDHHLRQFGR